ncbi:peptidoglycan-binding protein [Candidatus Parcubacteria bacterium]|nr:peptidoglycan-binding protein [Candidatus Parcubacteria bacterium]
MKKPLLILFRWRQFLNILTKKEKNVFFAFLILFFFSASFLLISFYFNNTEVKPARAGQYIEGVVGFPRFINPIYADVSDVDRDLVEILFAGLMKHNSVNGIVPDLVESFEILEQGKIYEFKLKENAVWSDKKLITADDVIFTIKTIQNPEIKSPLRARWLGVKIEKISEYGVRFILKDSSAVFLENCCLKIIPEHIWKDVSEQNFPLSPYNLKPISSGPYQFKSLSQDEKGNIKSLIMESNPKYFGEGPYLSRVSFLFFNTKDQLDKEMAGSDPNILNLSMPRYFALFFNSDNATEGAKILDEKDVRLALNYGTNKQEIIEQVLENQAKIVDSPILPEIYGFEKPSYIYEFDLEKAKEILDNTGFVANENNQRIKIVKKESSFQFKSNLQTGSKGLEVKELQKCLAKDPEIYPEGEITGYFGSKTKQAVIRFQEKYKQDILAPFGLENGTGQVKKTTRAKLNEICLKPPEEIIPMKLCLTTVNQPILIAVASLLKTQWQALGVEVEIKTYDISFLEREIIKPRDFEVLLFGEVLGAIPDPFPFWHSSQKKDPGLNLTGFGSKTADKLLESARASMDKETRKENLEEFQNILISDTQAVFLYNPDYLFSVQQEIKGINTKIITDPSKRFSGIENWYIKTKRVWK